MNSKSLKLLSILVITMIFSFTVKNNETFIGTYGVSDSNPAQIKLKINTDQTFEYQDFSVSNKKINIKGTWNLKNKKVFLNHEQTKFHNLWSFENDGQIAKSRKGLSFYRLCKLN